MPISCSMKKKSRKTIKINKNETGKKGIEYHKRKLKLLARFIGTLAGMFWLFFGLMEPFYGVTGFFMNILPGIILIICTDIAWRYGHTGIFLLLLIGFASFFALMIYGMSMLALVAGIPPILSGFVFIFGWYEKER